MPKPRNPTTPRYTPFDFFGYSTSQIILTQTGGTGHLGISTFGEGWNADFTEYTYVIVSPWWLETAVPSFWSGTVQMEDIAPTSDWPERSVLDGPVIKSIKIGSNNPISVRAEIK